MLFWGEGRKLAGKRHAKCEPLLDEMASIYLLNHLNHHISLWLYWLGHWISTSPWLCLLNSPTEVGATK